MSEMQAPTAVFVVISDLLFRSKIDDAARRAGVPLRVAKSVEQLDRHLGTSTPALVLVDLEMAGLDAPAMLGRLRATPAGATVPVIGFAGHTNVEVIHDRINIEIMRAFVRMRELLATNKAIAQQLHTLERKVASHDVAITDV